MFTPFPPVPGGPSPWGPIQTVRSLGPDAVVVTTASHGGIFVSAEGLARVPPALRGTAYSRGGGFEEDCDWAIPYLALGLHAYEPDRGAATLRAARRAVWRWRRGHAEALGVFEDPGVPRAL
jgi:hypothetical protein